MQRFVTGSALLILLLASGCVSKAVFDETERQAARLLQQLDECKFDNERLNKERGELYGDISHLEQRLAESLRESSGLRQDLLRARADVERSERLFASRDAEAAASVSAMRQEIDRLAEDNRQLNHQLERERLAREARLAQLRSTYEELVGKLESEIERGEITISELQGRLTVNLVERILFDSGEADIKPQGLQVLRRVGDILKSAQDRLIQVEGHTDNVPISPRLQATFATNWELSTARATNVVHVLQGQIGIPGERLSVVGYGPYRPIASNASAEGRAQNRRIQIVLAPLEAAGR